LQFHLRHLLVAKLYATEITARRSTRLSVLKNPSGRVKLSTPTILSINGFRFIIWPADHEPPHVHVFKDNGDDTQAPWLVTIHGLSKREVRQAWNIVAEHQQILLDAWRQIHGNLDD
jgi:hypothetical protein